MITNLCFGDYKLSTPVDKNKFILLEDTNVISKHTTYIQTTVGGLIGLINSQQSEIDYLKDLCVDCGYIVCARCGQVIYKDEAARSEKEQDYVCNDCKEQEE